jgi:hypothetical protein
MSFFHRGIIHRKEKSSYLNNRNSDRDRADSLADLLYQENARFQAIRIALNAQTLMSIQLIFYIIATMYKFI